jgi:hypothetical protein
VGGGDESPRSLQHKEESVDEKIRFGGITKVRNDSKRMTDINFSSLVDRIEMLEQQMKQIQERFEAARTALKKDKEK